MGGQQEITLAELQEYFTIPVVNYWRRHFPEVTGDELNVCYGQAIQEVQTSGLVKGIKKVLQKLVKSANLYIVSSDPESKIIPEIDKAQIKDLFVAISFGKHDKVSGLADFIKEYNINPKEAIYLGDTSGDIEAAHKNGLLAGAVAWGIQHDKLIKKVNPEYFFEKPEDILILVK